MLIETIGATGIFIGIVVLYFLSCIRFILEFERGVIFRLGRVLAKPKGPGVILVFWPIDRLVRISLRTQVDDVPPQDIITRDNVSVKVNAVVYSRVIDPHKAVLEVRIIVMPRVNSRKLRCAASWASQSLTNCCPNVIASTGCYRKSSIGRLIHGELKSQPWK